MGRGGAGAGFAAGGFDFTALDGGDSGTLAQSFAERELPYDVFRQPDPLPDYGATWEAATGRLPTDAFALLDVSTKADLLGISFGIGGGERYSRVVTHRPLPGSADLPVRVEGMNVVASSGSARAFTVPQVSWEPVLNLTEPKVPGDPRLGPNYYPDDGGATRILNNGTDTIALAPLPLTHFLARKLAKDDGFAALALSTLPFGLRSAMLLKKGYAYKGKARKGTEVSIRPQKYADALTSSLRLRIDGGEALREGDSAMFMGSTVQLNNVLDLSGGSTGDSTLGRDVTIIFNNEWMPQGGLIQQRGVPVERVDLSGYGASVFSNWLSPGAAIAETSQTKFDIWLGRCAHEIVQVRSIVYPWGIKVVRTITLLRAASNYTYRCDSGWRAESEGHFDFRYNAYKTDPADPGKLIPDPQPSPYAIHPGIVKALLNVHDIEPATDITPFKGDDTYPPKKSVDKEGVLNPGSARLPYDLEPLWFNADIEIENPISGYSETVGADGKPHKVVPGKRILGFVQLAPKGMPIQAKLLHDLIVRQGGTIGGTIDCAVEIAAKGGQQMRLSRFDFANAVGADGFSNEFAVAGRGSVLLPKDGSWSMVRHSFGTGEVSPVPKELAVPLVRVGALVDNGTGPLVPDRAPESVLLRIADPEDLLRTPTAQTTNYGFLQSTDTQKALFLTPAYHFGKTQLLSKSPPLFADAFRIASSKAIFPNVGKAIPGDIGDVISLADNPAQFEKIGGMKDGTSDVFALMEAAIPAGKAGAGYKLLGKLGSFDLPNKEWPLIDLGGSFRIYIEYKADKVQLPKPTGWNLGDPIATKSTKSGLDFDIDSFAGATPPWKSQMKNVSIVIDLGPIKKLMTIKGSWDAGKGKQAGFVGTPGDDQFPAPQIEFSPELGTVIEILQILQALQGSDYKDAFARGLKLAMSNKAGSWEYKLEASQEIPVLRFPTPDIFYNDPNVPLKIEAGLKLGAYFDAALTVPTDAKQLVPTAGAYLGFYGRMSVMCVSLSIATVYAVGQAHLDIGADSKGGPTIRMDFGFGAQIVVGLPIVGNVSVMYVVTAEVVGGKDALKISAGLLWQGQAELLGGLIGVTIMIEGKGSVERANERTDLIAQLSFAIDISLFLVIDINFSTSWEEHRQIA